MTFAKGVSGNRQGRPKNGTALTDVLRSKLDKRDADGVRPRDAIAEDLLRLTRHSDPNVRLKAIAYVYDRVDGKPKQALEHSQDPDQPLGIGVVAIDYRQSIAALAPAPENETGPMGDSEPSGEG